MSIDINSLQAFTDSELLKLARFSLAQLMLGKSVSFAGRTLQREDANSLIDLINWLETRVNSASESDGGFARIKVNRE